MLELVEELGRHHTDLVDDQGFQFPPPILDILLIHAGEIVNMVGDATAGKRVHRRAPDVSRRNARRRTDRYCIREILSMLLPEMHDDLSHQEGFACACIAGEEDISAFLDVLEDCGLLIAELGAVGLTGLLCFCSIAFSAPDCRRDMRRVCNIGYFILEREGGRSEG